jgi:CCR4-NOT transcription complex subunit 4
MVVQFLQVLRSNDYFGQYGKIAKLFLRKTPSSDSNGVPNGSSSSSSSSDTDLGIYITYLRREDAARAIAALDGYQAPNNPGKVLKATYGTTKYCLYFLRGMKCEDGGGLGGGSCLGLHEWAGEGDVFTRKDMTTL